MQTFEDYTYERPDLEREKALFSELLHDFTKAESVEEATDAIKEINAFRERLSTLGNLVFIRASIDTNDEFYQKERDFFDNIEPEIEELDINFYSELVKSPFRNELENQWGSQLFDIADCAMKAFSPKIIPLLQKENKLTSDYAKLVASAQIDLDGELYTLAQLDPFTQSKNRSIRKRAAEAKFNFFAEHAEQFDSI